MARSRLYWRGAAYDDDLDVALYQAVEAKHYAEQIQGVGFGTDEWVLTKDGLTEVPVGVDELLLAVVSWANRHPFRRREGWGHLPRAPRNWEAKIKEFTDTIALPASQSETGSNGE